VSCFTTTVSCYTIGICSYAPWPKPPVGTYSIDGGTEAANCADSESALLKEKKYVGLPNGRLPLLVGPSVVIDMISALSHGTGRLPLGEIASGAYIDQGGKAVTFVGEIAQEGSTVILYFEYIDHPDIRSFYAEIPVSEKGVIDYLSMTQVDVRRKVPAK